MKNKNKKNNKTKNKKNSNHSILSHAVSLAAHVPGIYEM